MAGTAPVAPRPERLNHDAFLNRIEQTCANPRLAEAGRLVLEESTYSFPGFKPARVDLFADWTVSPFGKRGWQWNTAALNFLPWLVALHAATGDARALAFARAAIASWRSALRTRLRRYEFARHDHATALRAENAMLLLAYLHREGLLADAWDELADFVDGIATQLEAPDFYSRHTNHGIEQARILALCADIIPAHPASARRWQLAMARLRDELAFAFTREGVNVENSPAYHHYVCNAFLKVVEGFPRERLHPLIDEIDQVMPGAMRFMAHVVRPDGRLPIIGDTAAKPAMNVFQAYAGRPEYQWLEYVTSGRTRGKAPPEKVVGFPEAGYLIARDRWKRPDMRGREFHLVMKCGYRSHYHRHDDDFNIVMACGEDWLIDGGAYDYAEAAPVRRYLRSKWAHNVPVVDEGGERWPRLPESRHAATLDWREEGDVVFVEAVSGGYPGLEARRSLELHPRERRFVVHDRLVPAAGAEGAAQPRMFRSLWHVPARKDLFRRGQEILVRSRKSSHALVIRNLGEPCDGAGPFRPGLERYANSVVSWRAHHLEPARVIAFSRHGHAFDCRLEFELVQARDLEGWDPL